MSPARLFFELSSMTHISLKSWRQNMDLHFDLEQKNLLHAMENPFSLSPNKPKVTTPSGKSCCRVSGTVKL